MCDLFPLNCVSNRFLFTILNPDYFTSTSSSNSDYETPGATYAIPAVRTVAVTRPGYTTVSAFSLRGCFVLPVPGVQHLTLTFL